MVDDDDDIISSLRLRLYLLVGAKTEKLAHLLDMLVINQQIVDEILRGATFHQLYVMSHRKTWH